ncbi:MULTISPECIES: hypothetical protein [unclassified Okeania]|uniref:hypothetical protein n=1 Tax=unclassified Okeania TaxID=2634635 RepID=UPI0013BBA5B5|nr:MULTISPECIES: hypothetical protein [unclassified Okeania]NES79378.1 hypothetical protein [Okeania sp. SIO1H4]NET23034.1 hypothetical protein [Okeania sp. SIO1H5]NET96547.1 hypothetical protein [Okeania sp. SIO1H2]
MLCIALCAGNRQQRCDPATTPVARECAPREATGNSSGRGIEEGDRRQETGDRRKITWGFSPQVILNTV